MKPIASIVIIGLCSSLFAGSALAADVVGDVEKGQTDFKHQCGVCHSLTANRVGPILSGVYGRKAGQVPEYTYSNALKSSNVVWDSANLDKWLTSCQNFIPGQKMNISISDAQKRADIIAYLKSISDQGGKK